MASINASTSGAGGIITTADNTGTLNIQSGGTTIATISSTGLAVASGKTLSVNGTTVPSNIPAFSAYKNTNQSITSSTFTKITFQVEDYDTNNNFASSTFTPTIAGYYMIGAGFNPNAGSPPSRVIMDIYKNGSQVKRLYDVTAKADNVSGSCLLYMNGSTDYLEVYGYIIASTATIYGVSADTFFTGVLIRGA